jgi:hypothetical protein
MFVLRVSDIRPSDLGITRKLMGAAAAVLLICWSPMAFAGEAATAPSPAQPAPDRDEGLLKNLAKKANIATDVAEPQDFVVKSRPATTDYVPVFRKNEEHKAKVLTPDQLKAMETDLNAASSHNAQIRDAFPPARKAYLDEERAKAEKAAAKRSKEGPTTAQQ